MKNLFKYFSVFAIATAVGLNTMNVQAAEKACEAGQTMHTHYFMFLDNNTAKYYKDGVAGVAGTSKIFTTWNSAKKYTVFNGTVLEHGPLGVTNGTKTTTSNTSMSPWTVEEYWRKFYKAYNNLDSNLVYKDGNDAYILHDTWVSYEEGYLNPTNRFHATDDLDKALNETLKNLINGNSLAGSTLVTAGTNVPEANIEAPSSDWGTSSETELTWKIDRKIRTEDALDGVPMGGMNRVYSPAVYYVKWCENAKEDTTEKYIEYDKNTTSEVTNMPLKEVFKKTCTNISAMVPERTDGYKFVGWSKDPKASVEDTRKDATFAPGAEYCKESIKLYAIWEPVTTNPDGSYTVTYDPNGGKGEPAPQSASSGSCLNISSGKPTLTGNNFLGWSMDKNAKEPDKNFAAGSEYCGKQGNITLYAVWQTQTGISAHFIVFGAIALIAGAALAVAKKKDLFKQI